MNAVNISSSINKCDIGIDNRTAKLVRVQSGGLNDYRQSMF